MKLDKKTFKKWQDWHKIIQEDLTIILHYKEIQEYLFEIVPLNADHIDANHGGFFLNYVKECYGCYTAVGVRRIAKKSSDKSSITLVRLLEQIKDCADQFTYDFFLEIFPQGGFDWQKSTFDKFSDNSNVISTIKIENDIRELEKISKKVFDLVDRRIAHIDKRKIPIITFQDISDPLDVLNSIICRYSSLLTSRSILHSLKPEIQYNWKDIFKVPIDIRENP